ncbi:MGMT family protein [candidate division WOR-3 bacterium]|nr:MGMT family protein [candidate division WOR-3 bacterium]
MPVYTINSKFGKIRILWTLKDGLFKIASVKIGEEKRAPENPNEPQENYLVEERIKNFVYNLSALLKGWEIEFDPDILDLSVCGAFQKRVLEAMCRVPRGKICAYKEVAVFLNSPNSSRAVGRALSKNPFPFVIPCHRAIRSDGSIGGYQGGENMKRSLLEMEGIDFDIKGKVFIKEFLYDFTGN